MDLPLALSVHRYVTSVGAYVGLASIIGLAILVLLFFAQARETSALRDHVDELLDRISGLESRLARQAQLHAEAQAAQVQAQAQAAQAGAAQARQQAAPALAAVSGGRTAFALPPGPPAGVGAPALSAATRVIPLAAPAMAAAGSGGGGGGVATLDPPAPVTPAASNGSSRAVPVGVPSPSRTGPVREAPAPARAPATSAGASGPGRRQAPRPLPPPRERVSGGRPRRAIALVLGLLAAAAAVAVVVVLTSSSKSSHSSSVASRQTTTPRSAGAAVQINPHTITVAVLNGTATPGLAHRTAQRLAGDGFQEGKITTASDQTHSTTTVAFIPGAKAQALAVAKALKLGAATLAPVDQGTRAVACEGLPTCTASVFVTVGANLASQ